MARSGRLPPADGSPSIVILGAGVVKLADTGDLKSPARKGVRVRVPAPAPTRDPGRALQELADIRFLLHLPGVDTAEIRDCFDRAGLREQYDDIKKSL